MHSDAMCTANIEHLKLTVFGVCAGVVPHARISKKRFGRHMCPPSNQNCGQLVSNELQYMNKHDEMRQWQSMELMRAQNFQV